MKIEIEKCAGTTPSVYHFNVRTDGKETGPLQFDEMLALVAAIAMPEPRPCLHWLTPVTPPSKGGGQ